ncbi:MAG TPA: hypothetical protein VFH56_14640 [Acidimicrobiales bacterium]|nr:hypothetical protein [Acidimicrobiales bacterium]
MDGSVVGRDDHEPQNRVQGRGWTIPLPYPRPPLNLNQRMHWAPRNRLTQQIKSDVHTLARLHKLPTGLDRVIVTLHWQPTTNRRRDSDNPSPTLKAAIDGLTQYGLTADDNSAHVWSATIIEPRAAQAAVWLTIEEAA